MKLLLTTIFALVSSTAFAADLKIGVLDKNKALFDSTAAKEVNEKLRQDYGVKEEQAAKLEQEIQTIRQDYQTDKDLLTEEDVAELNTSLKRL